MHSFVYRMIHTTVLLSGSGSVLLPPCMDPATETCNKNKYPNI